MNDNIIYKELKLESEEKTDENCFIVEMLNDQGNKELSIARARVLPGQKTEWHNLTGTNEYYYILSGVGLAEIGDEFRKRMAPHSIVKIPAGMRQRIINDGEEDLIFLCLCTPRFKFDNYKSCE